MTRFVSVYYECSAFIRSFDTGYYHSLPLSINRTFIFILDIVLDTLIGYTITKGWRSERERSEKEYAHSAQLCSVMARGTYTILKVQKERYNYRVTRHLDSYILLTSVSDVPLACLGSS